MADEPAIRAAITKDFLAAVRQEGDDLVEQVRSAAPVTILGDVDRTTRLGWVPLRDHLALGESVRQLTGDATFRAIWRRGMLRSFGGSTLRPLIDGALRLFGATPSGLTKIAPRAWALVLRDAGQLVLETAAGANEARVALIGFPPELFASRTFIVGLAGCLEGIYDLCAVTGAVTISREQPAAGAALFELRWE